MLRADSLTIKKERSGEKGDFGHINWHHQSYFWNRNLLQFNDE